MCSVEVVHGSGSNWRRLQNESDFLYKACNTSARDATIFLSSMNAAQNVNKLAQNTALNQKTSGINAALKYTGIPASWLSKRPKLPSRNWLIFLSFTSSVIGFYVYDRQQCKRIRQSYIDKVKDLAEQPLAALDKPRKVMVYGAKWPGDEDYDQSLKYFRKYVKVGEIIP